jgi:phage terminase large subunit
MFKQPREDALLIEMGWRDNPYFPQVLVSEKDHCQLTDPEKYEWIWEGKCLRHNAAQIFKGKWIIGDVLDQPEGASVYCGLDFGFSQDPTAAVCCYTYDGNLYIQKEAGGIGIEIDSTYKVLDAILPSKQWPCRADSARPETISFLNRQGYNIVAAKKGVSSVEDGISFMKSFKQIIIDRRCEKTIDEFRNYAYKCDAKTGDILPIIIDKWNHYIDSCRYSIESLWKHDVVMY